MELIKIGHEVYLFPSWMLDMAAAVLGDVHAIKMVRSHFFRERISDWLERFAREMETAKKIAA